MALTRIITASAPEPSLTVLDADDPLHITPSNINGAVLAQVIADKSVPDVYLPTVTGGQTAFTLPTVPLNANSVRVLVNGIEYYNADSWTFAGAALTWTEGFALSSTDEVRILYI